MNDLKIIHVEGKMALVFDNGVTLTTEETKEVSVEQTEVGFKQFLTDLFESEKMSPEEQEKVMQMSVKDFCDMVEKILQANANVAYQGEEDDNPIPPGVPKMQFLMNPIAYVCPKCKQKNVFKVIDGHLVCSACTHDFGDVDELRDTTEVK